MPERTDPTDTLRTMIGMVKLTRKMVMDAHHTHELMELDMLLNVVESEAFRQLGAREKAKQAGAGTGGQSG